MGMTAGTGGGNGTGGWVNEIPSSRLLLYERSFRVESARVWGALDCERVRTCLCVYGCSKLGLNTVFTNFICASAFARICSQAPPACVGGAFNARAMLMHKSAPSDRKVLTPFPIPWAHARTHAPAHPHTPTDTHTLTYAHIRTFPAKASAEELFDTFARSHARARMHGDARECV